MDRAEAHHLAQTGMLFIPSDSRKITPYPNAEAIHREMADALQVHPSTLPVPTVVVCPANLFEQAWQAIVHNKWDNPILKSHFHVLHSEGRIEFVRNR